MHNRVSQCSFSPFNRNVYSAPVTLGQPLPVSRGPDVFVQLRHLQ